MPQLTEWESFYVIVGSSAAALTGLMFVVITLIADLEEQRSSGGALAAFGTPTVVHFCAALIVSATLSAPWHSLTRVAAALAVCGIWGVSYTFIVARRARRQDTYQPVFEDWLWHTVLPLGAYTALFLAAVVLPRDVEPSLFVVAAAVLSLVLIGIHNSWDTVTYLALSRHEGQHKPGS